MFSLLFLVGVAGPRFVNGQIAQTNATCIPDFSWMGNSRNSSPCLVAAQLDAQCNYGSWFIPSIDAGHRYDPPYNQTATLCTCSWASYNLITACSSCQGFPDTLPNWGFYISGCSGKTTDNKYWPPTIPFPTDVKIPYWASTDPTTWPNQRFSPADAKTIYQASHADLPMATPSSSPSSSPPIGAIVGAVIGGLIVIVSFAACYMWIIRKHRGAMHSTAHPNDLLSHTRKISDSTVTTGNVTLRDSSSLRPLVQTPSVTNVQRSTSLSSLPFFSSLIGRDSRAVHVGQTPAPQDPGLPPIEEVITPYTLHPTNDAPEKKHSDGEWPIFDQPSAPPPNAVRMTVLPSTPPRKSGTSRYNPPAYTESDTTTPTVSRHQPQDSIDSNASTPQGSDGSEGMVRPANSGSSIGHMEMSNPVRASTSTIQTSGSTRRTSAGGFSTRPYGRSLFTVHSRDTMSPTEESFSPTEIA